MTKNVLNKFGFARIALAASVGFPLILASNAFAQRAAAPPPPPPPGAAQVGAPSAIGAAAPAAEVERVIVTGSLIPTAEEVGANPVYNLNRDLINKSGQGTTVETILKSQTVMGANSVPVQNNGTAQGGPVGTASISLRGFDPSASLVLWDGRRVAPFPGSSNSGGGFVDLVSLPIPAVQSIEILKDGASTAYGADAVAGVINFKPYTDYRGAQVTVGYGNTLDKDAAEYYGDVLFGTGDDKTSITGDIFYYKHHDVFNHDRGNSLVPPFLSSNASPWNFQINNIVAEQAGGVNVFPGENKNEFATVPNGSNGLSPASDFFFQATRIRNSHNTFEGQPTPGWNFNSTSSSFPKQERWGGYAAFEHKICDDQFRIFGDFFYVDAKTHDELAPGATGDFETPGSPTLFIPPNHPFTNDTPGAPGGPPVGTPTAAEVGMPAGAFNPFNPFQQILSGTSRARLFEFGNRLFDNENIAELFTVGVKGDKLFNGTWGYDGAFRYSQIQQQAQVKDTNSLRFEQILDANNALFNPASTNFIGQTTPFNPFGDPSHVPIPSNAPLVDFATLNENNILTMKLATLDLNIYTTDLFDLPAGGVGLAFGGSFSRQTYNLDFDDQARLGQEVGVGIARPTKAGRKEWAIYAETLIPIFSPKYHIPGFYNLEFSAGVRYEAWLNNDTNACVPKVGVRWQPFDESLTIRSTWGEGFLEPSMGQLNGPTIFGLAPATFEGVSNPETTVVEVPNKNLSPEHDRTWTGGIVYTPKWIPTKWGTLTLTIDFWDVERTGVVVFVSPQQIITGYNAGTVPGFVSPAQPPPTGPAVLFAPDGSFNGVQSPFTNGGKENARGVDLGLQYQIETQYGIFTFLTRWSYLDQFVFQFPGQRAYQVAGRANNDWFEGNFFGQTTGGDAWYKWKGLTNVDWTWHNFDFNVTLHTIDGFWETLFGKVPDGFFKQHYVHPTWFTDAQLSYSLIFTPPVEAAPVPGYSKGGKEVVGKEKETPPVPYVMPCWKTILNNTTFTVGVNNIFGEDPPKEFGQEATGNSTGYPGFSYDNIGRFWYVRMIKKF